MMLCSTALPAARAEASSKPTTARNEAVFHLHHIRASLASQQSFTCITSELQKCPRAAPGARRAPAMNR